MPRAPLDPGSLAPVVFEAAADGDRVAAGILEQAGQEVARAVKVIFERLFPEPGAVTVVFGGAVFMRGVSPVLIGTVQQEVGKQRPDTRFVRLETQPVLGAVAFAFDDAGWPAGGRVWSELRSSYARVAGESEQEGA